MAWWEYVQDVTGRASQQEIARRLGIASSSVNRWKSSDPRPETVRAFAVAFGRPVAEAFVAAGHLRPEDLKDTGDAASVRRGSGLLPVEEAVEAIWRLETLSESTRRLLILDQLERGAAQSGEASVSEGR
ncbi:helix-turn-helix transcriptional regulator [Actinopolymorpha sp. B9G3]|uniref:helix-turn-helix domain-containing protein n=1 Tax=Actinopolymorpha sp. B9G3 TaxID=3158970 RepID=UPI0032D8F5C0